MSEYKYVKSGGACLNQDDGSYEKYLQQRARLQSQQHKSSDIESRVTVMEKDLSDIKSLLQQLIDKV